jgi:hypothetical protein
MFDGVSVGAAVHPAVHDAARYLVWCVHPGGRVDRVVAMIASQLRTAAQ